MKISLEAKNPVKVENQTLVLTLLRGYLSNAGDLKLWFS